MELSAYHPASFNVAPRRCSWCSRVWTFGAWRDVTTVGPTTDTLCPRCEISLLLGEHPTPERVDVLLAELQLRRPAADMLTAGVERREKDDAALRSIPGRVRWWRVKQAWSGVWPWLAIAVAMGGYAAALWPAGR